MLAIISLSLSGIANLFLGFVKSKKVLLPTTLLFLALAFGLNMLDWNTHALYFGNMLRVDNLFINFSGIILLSALLVTALTRHFNPSDPTSHPAEYYAIMLFSLAGAMMMVGFENFIMLFVGVEVLSVAMYVLAGTDKRNVRSNEAALKYFLMGAFATGILLFGMALVYGATGSFSLTGIGSYTTINAKYNAVSPMLYVGSLLMLIGMLFKVSAAPFHFWTPDVYEGSPTVFTAFMSTVVKTAGFAALFKLTSVAFAGVAGFWEGTLGFITILTLLVGNLTAAYQTSVKRMLAYSGVSHAGYLLLAVSAQAATTASAILFYSLAYVIATVAAFGVLILVSENTQSDGLDDETYTAFNGLGQRSPLLAFVMAVAMLSLAGIPLTAGFLGKLFVFSATISGGFTSLVIIAVLTSAVGAFYYLRVIIAMYFRPSENSEAIAIPPLFRVVLVLCATLTLVLGIFPDIIKNLF